MGLTVEEVEAALLKIWPDEHWRDFEEATEHNCHSASLALVKSGLIPGSRVARGACRGVGGQHSWVVQGSEPRDVYDPCVTIIDITLWSYDDSKPRVWIGTQEDGLHTPHFTGNIWQAGCPESGGEEEVELTPKTPFSPMAEEWIRIFRRRAGGPLDYRFWGGAFTRLPYEGWPSGEFTLAGYQTPMVRPLIPIDRVGMHTNLNPEGLYLP